MRDNKPISRDKIIDNQMKLIGYFQDSLLKNRWKEYQRIHTRVMDVKVETPEYIDLCDKLRDLEGVIDQQLKDKANALGRERTMTDVFDRDQKNRKRLGL
jgi:hypothetical protein